MKGVNFHVGAGIAEIQLGNPGKLNALTVEMLDALARCLNEIDRRDDIYCVILSAVEGRAFCAGADIHAWADMPPHLFARRWVRDGHRIFDSLAGLSRPTIAALGAPALGGGLELAAACDIRVMHPSATVSFPETGIGIVPGWSGTQRLSRLLPEPVLKEMILFGRPLSADRAVAIGFAAEIADDVRMRAKEIAADIVGRSARATEVAKYMIHAAVGENREAMIEVLGSGMAAASADKAEGVSAFRDKRPAEFPGM